MKATVIKNYKHLLKECFASDPILLEKFHIYAGQGLDACVDKTYNDLQFCNTIVFEIRKDNQLVGYFGKENFDNKEYLTGFFIVPNFRDQKSKVWDLISIEFNCPFYCGLYEKNQPANKFIQSRGGQIVKQLIIDDNSVIMYQVGA